jgi:hypothetical protein
LILYRLPHLKRAGYYYVKALPIFPMGQTGCRYPTLTASSVSVMDLTEMQLFLPKSLRTALTFTTI